MKGKSGPLKIGGGGKIWTGKETVRGTLIGQWSNSTSLAEAGDFGKEKCRNPPFGTSRCARKSKQAKVICYVKTDDGNSTEWGRPPRRGRHSSYATASHCV